MRMKSFCVLGNAGSAGLECNMHLTMEVKKLSTDFSRRGGFGNLTSDSHCDRLQHESLKNKSRCFVIANPS